MCNQLVLEKRRWQKNPHARALAHSHTNSNEWPTWQVTLAKIEGSGKIFLGPRCLHINHGCPSRLPRPLRFGQRPCTTRRVTAPSLLVPSSAALCPSVRWAKLTWRHGRGVSRRAGQRSHGIATCEGGSTTGALISWNANCSGKTSTITPPLI